MSLSSEPTKKKAKKDWEFYVSQGPFLVQNAVCFCSLPFVALFTCHFENKMIIQPDVNHHWVNDSTLTKLHNAADPNGKKVIDVFNAEPSYYDWMLKNDFSLDTKRKLTQIKLRAFSQG